MIKRKKKRNGTKKNVSPKVQEASSVSDVEASESDPEVEAEEEQDSEEGTPETAEDSGEESEAAPEVDEEKKSPVPNWEVTCVDRPTGSPGFLVFKMSNNLKLVAKEENFLRWLLSPAAKR